MRLRPMLRALTVAAVALGGLTLPGTAHAGECQEVYGQALGYGRSRWRTSYMAMALNDSTFPSGGAGGAIRARLNDAARSWRDSLNVCGMSDTLAAEPLINPFATTATFNPYRNDGTSVVDFGWVDLNGCPHGATLACAISFTDSDGYFNDSNIRFESYAGFNWWGGSDGNGQGNAYSTYVPSGWYDIWGVGAHEIGHALGIDHAPYDNPHATMRPQFCPGMGWAGCTNDPRQSAQESSATARTLAPSDIYVMRALYANPLG
ncbi:MAG TPA: hypothetical protein VNA20_04735 [Frankiaceae bacterium]|nr:hypothetical protein [Frankiaceae bacterium]